MTVTLPATSGVGLRAPYYADFAQKAGLTGFLEIHPENYFGGGLRLAYLQEASKNYPLSFHCVGLSLGSTSKPKPQHLASLKKLVERFKPAAVSDHLSWSASGNAHLNDLLPLPYTRETLSFVMSNIDHVQQTLGRPLLIENPSVYLSYKENHFHEADFLNELCSRTGCGILLDVNNIYVNAHNNGVHAEDYIGLIKATYVKQIHLSGHTKAGDATGRLIIDTHDHPTCEEVWSLYDYTLSRFGRTPTLIEWDGQFPPLADLLDEADRAKAMIETVFVGSHAAA